MNDSQVDPDPSDEEISFAQRIAEIKEHPLWPEFVALCPQHGVNPEDHVDDWIEWWAFFFAGSTAQAKLQANAQSHLVTSLPAQPTPAAVQPSEAELKRRKTKP